MLKKLEIIHLAQQHSVSEEKCRYFSQHEKKLLTEAIAYSQFKVAQAIIEYKGCLVVNEDTHLDETYISNHQMKPEVKKAIIAAFPTGLSEKFSDLIATQKEMLAFYSGPYVLLALKKISKIYPAGSVSQALIEDPSNELQSAREEAAIYYARAAWDYDYDTQKKFIEMGMTVSLEKEKPVLLVYGASHNFQSYDKTNKSGTELAITVIDCIDHRHLLKNQFLKDDKTRLVFWLGLFVVAVGVFIENLGLLSLMAVILSCIPAVLSAINLAKTYQVEKDIITCTQKKVGEQVSQNAKNSYLTMGLSFFSEISGLTAQCAKISDLSNEVRSDCSI